jgi:hypothetical protein
MPHFTEPSTPAATITTLDEKLTDADTTAPARFLHDHHLTSETLPFWLVNLPRSRWTAECPEFLRDQPPKNIQCLSMPDDHYTRQNWGEVKEIISEPTCSRPYCCSRLTTARNQPDRSVPACPERPPQVPRIHRANQSRILLGHEIRGQRTTTLG